MLDPRCDRAHEVVEVDRLVRLPHPLRSTEIPDAAPGRNACSSEDEDTLGPAYQRSEIVQLHAITLAEWVLSTVVTMTRSGLVASSIPSKLENVGQSTPM